MSEFIAEDVVDGQRVITTKNIEGDVQNYSSTLAEVLVDVGSGVMQRCMAVKDFGGGSGGASSFADLSGSPYDNENLSDALNDKQDELVSGTNIKTINNTSVLGEGNISVVGLPSQTGNAEKLLTTDGTNASWMTKDYYRSLSDAQAETLLSDGTYKGKDVDSGEIFVCADGNVKQYTEQNQGASLQTESYENPFYPCDNYVVENIGGEDVEVLYAATTIAGGSPLNLWKSIDKGATWESVNTTRGDAPAETQQRIFYKNGVFYATRYFYDGGGSCYTYLDVSTDGWVSCQTHLISRSSSSNGFDNPQNGYICFLDNYIFIGSNNNVFRASLSDLDTWANITTAKVGGFNGLLVRRDAYSSDYGDSWTSNGLDYLNGDFFIANNKMYIQRNESGGTLYESSNGMSFSYFANVGFMASAFATHQGSDLIFAFANGTVRVASAVVGVGTWTQLTTSWYYNSQIVVPFDDVLFAFTSDYTTYPVTRGLYLIVYERKLSVLNVGSGVPDSSTVGYVGKLSVDGSGNAYMCVGVSGSTYTWKQITLTSI